MNLFSNKHLLAYQINKILFGKSIKQGTIKIFEEKNVKNGRFDEGPHVLVK